MHTIERHGLLALGCLFALFVATGCFQAAGDTLQATGIAQGVATFTPAASPTDLPSLTPEAVEDEDEGQGDFGLDITDTPDSAASVREQDEDAQIQDIDPLNLTSTAIIERATVTAAAQLTATAQAEITQFVPTSEPTLIVVDTPIPSGPIVSGADCIHQVQATDRNLWQISLLYGVTVHEIAAVSGISNIQLILVGQQLTIPGCGTTGYRPPPITGDQGGGGIPPASGRVHVVRQRETLFSIALQYGTTVSQLAALNGISNINLIYIDQNIALP